MATVYFGRAFATAIWCRRNASSKTCTRCAVKRPKGRTCSAAVLAQHHGVSLFKPEQPKLVVDSSVKYCRRDVVDGTDFAQRQLWCCGLLADEYSERVTSPAQFGGSVDGHLVLAYAPSFLRFGPITSSPPDRTATGFRRRQRGSCKTSRPASRSTSFYSACRLASASKILGRTK